jgi:predicted dienelactone hydrolase
MLAEQAAPVRGNGRLVVISHGSGGSPWVHADLARSLVEAGFVVAMPQHRGDNYRDDRDPGPDSWTLRPQEVSRAIDAVAQDPRFAPLLKLDKVGMYGMSAGGHTALSMAGGLHAALRSPSGGGLPVLRGPDHPAHGGAFDGLKRGRWR